MPFKKTKDGWVHDPKGKARIPTKKGLYGKPIPPMRSNVVGVHGEGLPTFSNGEIDWARVIREANEREN